eukprot:593586-Rhodomonas_salina.2
MINTQLARSRVEVARVRAPAALPARSTRWIREKGTGRSEALLLFHQRQSQRLLVMGSARWTLTWQHPEHCTCLQAGQSWTKLAMDACPSILQDGFTRSAAAVDDHLQR